MDYRHPQFGKPVPCPHSVHEPERAKKLAKVSGLSEKDLARRLSDIKVNNQNQEMLEAARAMIDKPYGWLYLWGGRGNAKTEALIAIVNELNKKGYTPVLYTKFAKIVDYMRDAYGERKKRETDPDADLGYIARFEQLKAVKVLAIDEMEKAKDTEFVEMFRFDFLDDRYRQAVHGETVTIFAGNNNPEQFDIVLYDRISDGRFRIVHNTAGSARKAMKRDDNIIVQPANGLHL